MGGGRWALRRRLGREVVYDTRASQGCSLAMKIGVWKDSWMPEPLATETEPLQDS